MSEKHKMFQYYIKQIRQRLNVKGILMYNGEGKRKLILIGSPFARISAVNDNRAKP